MVVSLKNEIFIVPIRQKNKLALCLPPALKKRNITETKKQLKNLADVAADTDYARITLVGIANRKRDKGFSYSNACVD